MADRTPRKPKIDLGDLQQPAEQALDEEAQEAAGGLLAVSGVRPSRLGTQSEGSPDPCTGCEAAVRKVSPTR
jgi:hypothetical protein